MDIRLKNLLAAFQRAKEPTSVDLDTFLLSLPKPEELPSPWETWTLICLVRHRKRQLWVAEIITNRLRGELSSLAKLGSLGHPEGAQSGTVPGLPEWEYYFHGRGCCLTHKVDGDRIDVDFWDNSAEYFDTFFYINYLDSLRHLELPEQRLRELHRWTRSVKVSIDDLMELGMLTRHAEPQSHPYRIPKAILKCSEEIDTFCMKWADPNERIWLAALIGDWSVVLEATKNHPNLQSRCSLWNERCHELRRKNLSQKIKKHNDADALIALANLNSHDLSEHLEYALNRVPSGLTSVALQIMENYDSSWTPDISHWYPLVYALFSRIDPSGELPQPHIWIASLKFLLQHNYRRKDLLAALPKAGGTSIGEAVLIALENAPELALPLIRQGLFSRIPINRAQVSAILALIDLPWSRKELLGVLIKSDDQEMTADARAALLETRDEAAQNAVLDWEQRNPHENEAGNYLEIDGRLVGPFYSLGEISLTDRASWIRFQMEELHDRVMKLKNVLPTKPRS